MKYCTILCSSLIAGAAFAAGGLHAQQPATVKAKPTAEAGPKAEAEAKPKPEKEPADPAKAAQDYKDVLEAFETAVKQDRLADADKHALELLAIAQRPVVQAPRPWAGAYATLNTIIATFSGKKLFASQYTLKYYDMAKKELSENDIAERTLLTVSHMEFLKQYALIEEADADKAIMSAWMEAVEKLDPKQYGELRARARNRWLSIPQEALQKMVERHPPLEGTLMWDKVFEYRFNADKQVELCDEILANPTLEKIHATSKVMRCEALRKAARYDDAIRYARDCANKTPNPGEKRDLLGQAAQAWRSLATRRYCAEPDKKDMMEAVKIYQEMLGWTRFNETREMTSILLELADCAVTAERYDLTEATLRRFFDLEAGDRDRALLIRSRMYYKDKQYGKVVETLETAEVTKNLNPYWTWEPLFNMLVRSCYATKQYDKMFQYESQILKVTRGAVQARWKADFAEVRKRLEAQKTAK